MVSIRRYPFPFKAMLAICSDIDQARIDSFREIHRFLNTEADTSLGSGLGLDIADSLWVFKGKPSPDAFRDNLGYFDGYSWDAPSRYGSEILEYARSGWIDTMHTYGNFNAMRDMEVRFTREHAERALELLETNGVRLRVWVNHGNAQNNYQNIGIHPTMYGDQPDTPEYHVDLLKRYGTEFIWLHGRTHEPGHQSVTNVYELRDGSKIFGFYRYHTAKTADAARLGIERQLNVNRDYVQVWVPRGLDHQLSASVLDGLVENGLTSIVGQHLGALMPMTAFDAEMAQAFRRLKRYHDDGRILVARTSRALHYSRVRDYLSFSTIVQDGTLTIQIDGVDDPVRGRWWPGIEDLRGITFEMEPYADVSIRVGGEYVPRKELAQHRSRDGITVAGIRWFDPDTTDYAAPFLAEERSTYVLWSPSARSAAVRQTQRASNLLSELCGSPPESSLPEGGQHRSAVGQALQDYRHGLAHYIAAFELLGFVELREGIEIGSGAGHWCAAFLQHAKRVVGVDRDAESVALARRLADHLGYGERAEFVQACPEELAYREPRFDCAWSCGELMVADIEPAIGRIAACLAAYGSFYVSYPTARAHLREIGTALSQAPAQAPAQALAQRREKSSARRALRRLLSGELHRCGVYHTPEKVRLLDAGDILRACRVFGFTYAGKPGVFDDVVDPFGHPICVELLVRKEKTHDTFRNRLLERQAVEVSWVEDLRNIARSGCPQLVCDTLEMVDPSLADEENLDIFARALIRSGRAPARNDIFPDGRMLPDDIMGLYWRDCGKIDLALACYQRMPASHPEKGFLIGECLLEKGAWKDAQRAFRGAIQSGGAGIREWAGMMAAQFHAGDRLAAEQSLATLTRSLSDAPRFGSTQLPAAADQ